MEFKYTLNRFAFTEPLSPNDALWDSAPYCPSRKAKGSIFINRAKSRNTSPPFTGEKVMTSDIFT